ncbi:MAG TPA: hypothetical protein VK920_01270 [Solirubrobacterales bacterium]|nr:hypothetical protein [Solirubrobacterales bacterium]
MDTVSGAIGTERRISYVTLPTLVGGAPGSRLSAPMRSIARPSSAAGGPACCPSGSHGPRVSSVGTNSSASRSKKASAKGRAYYARPTGPERVVNLLHRPGEEALAKENGHGRGDAKRPSEVEDERGSARPSDEQLAAAVGGAEPPPA